MSAQLDTGAWGLFCGEEGRQLVLIDEQPCGPVSSRKVMRAIPRRLLLDEGRVAQVFRSGVAVSEQLSCGGSEWNLELRPLSSPRSGAVLAVFAGLWAVGEAIPDVPLVGCWEWEIERDENGVPSSNRRTYWDENIFRIYDVDPSLAEQHPGYWETSFWANELIDQTDQMRVNGSIRDGLQDALAGDWGVVRCLTCNIVTGYGSSSPGRKHLRLAGQIAPISDEDPLIIMQGFSYEVPSTFHDLALEQDAARVDDVLRGVMQLTREPMAVVDVTSRTVLVSSPSWRQGVPGFVGDFDNAVFDGPSEVRDVIVEAAEDTQRPRTTEVSLQQQDGSVRTVQLTALGVSSSEHSRDAVIWLDL